MGIKAIRHPVKVKDKSNGIQHTIATLGMYVHLSHQFKGTHMSRFVEMMNNQERALSVESFESMLRQMIGKLEAESGYIEMCFPYFINTSAPAPGVMSLLDYEVTFIGEMKAGKYHQTVNILVPCTSLWLCSNWISKYGAHNQRSHITITVRTHDFLDRGLDTHRRRECFQPTLWTSEAP